MKSFAKMSTFYEVSDIQNNIFHFVSCIRRLLWFDFSHKFIVTFLNSRVQNLGKIGNENVDMTYLIV